MLVFHPAEQFRPTKVQSFVADSQLEQFTGSGWTVIDADPEPGGLGSLPPGFYRLNQTGCFAGSALAGIGCYAAAWAEGSGGDAVYGRVVRTPDRIVLQYWLFYYHNPLLLPPVPSVGVFWQSHEGDWEVVNVILDAAGEPLEAAYSQHCSGQRKAWADVEKRDGTRPVAYVGLGSHANFFAPGAGPLGVVPFNPLCIPPFVPAFIPVVDQVLAGPEGRQTIHRIEGMPWAAFPGRWGESEYFFTPIPLGPFPAGALEVGLAPATPTFQANWNPAVVLGWPSS